MSTDSSSRPAASRTTAGSSVGPRRVSERVSVEKSYRRTFSTMVRPESPASRSRRTHRSASRVTSVRTRTRSWMSTSYVSSTETDFVSRSATTGRSSRASAMAYSDCPCALPRSRTSSASPASAISSTVVIPPRRRWSPVAGPTPGRVRTDIGPSRARSVPGRIITRPSGLACSEPILASILEAASPTEPVSPVTALMSARSLTPASRADSSSQATPPASRSTKASSRLSGSTSGDRARSSPMTWSLMAR